MDNTQIKVTIKNKGDFVLELYPQFAPETCDNFETLVRDGFYNGLTFHRVVKDFMAQGGDPEGTGMGGSGKNIRGEFLANGFEKNTLSHTRGVISMARSQFPDSASSQFFICYGDCTFLDGQYAAFGKVISGMEIVDSFCDGELGFNSMGEMAVPKEPIIIEKMEVIE